MSFYLSFLGAPGSGKGTQSSLIQELYNIDAFSTGDLIRSEVDKGTEIGILAKDYILNGDLVPDKVIIEMFESYVLNHNLISKGFISDGYPRSLKQAESFVNLLNHGKFPLKIMYLDVSIDTLKSRLLNRGRLDDNEKSIERRFKVYNNVIENLKSIFKNELIYINGEQTPEMVFAEIKKYLTH